MRIIYKIIYYFRSINWIWPTSLYHNPSENFCTTSSPLGLIFKSSITVYIFLFLHICLSVKPKTPFTRILSQFQILLKVISFNFNCSGFFFIPLQIQLLLLILVPFLFYLFSTQYTVDRLNSLTSIHLCFCLCNGVPFFCTNLIAWLSFDFFFFLMKSSNPGMFSNFIWILFFFGLTDNDLGWKLDTCDIFFLF